MVEGCDQAENGAPVKEVQKQGDDYQGHLAAWYADVDGDVLFLGFLWQTASISTAAV